MLLVLVAVIAALLPANYRKICLPRLVIVVAAVVVFVVVVVRALLDNCVQTTSSSSLSLSTTDATRRLLYTPFWARCRLHSFSACLRLAMRFWTGDYYHMSARDLLYVQYTSIYTICMYSFATLRGTLHGIGLRGCD